MDVNSEAWIARCLLKEQRSAMLATEMDGQPFASLVTPAVAPDGAVLMLLSTMAVHSKHLATNPNCAVMVAGPPTDLNPQTSPRLTVTGIAERQDDRAMRAYWLARHPYARLYADFSDFVLWRLVPREGFFVGGFARATNLSAEHLTSPTAAVAAIIEAEARIISHCNADHEDALGKLAHAHGASGRWKMIGVDCDGFDLLQDETVMRIAFDAPVTDAVGVRAALVRMIEGLKHRRW